MGLISPGIGAHLLRMPAAAACLSFVLVAVALLASPAAQAQTGRLNDTGQTSCFNASDTVVPCDAATVGNSGTRPHQDGRYGRDAAQAIGSLPAKTGGGAAGFDFSCVLWNGTVVNGSNCSAGLVANTTGTASGTPATDWACTKDNVTGLVWSLQTQTASWDTASAAGYANTGHNSASRCGYSTGWRLPTRRELLSIVHFGAGSSPTVDATYFPATQSSRYWTADVDAQDASNAWTVRFLDAYSVSFIKTGADYVRLVRNVP